MPTTVINVYDRPTYQTEKVKGWDTVRVFKGSSLVSNANNTDMIFEASEGENLIQQFLSPSLPNVASNYKGTNFFELTKLENFDSFRIKANGLLNPDCKESAPKTRLAIDFSIFSEDYSSLLGAVRSNYGTLINIPSSSYWIDWYLDIEVTFFIDPNDNSYNFIVNGNFSFSRDAADNERLNVSLVPFCGLISGITDNKSVMDFNIAISNLINPLYIKQVSIDFVE
jgi:hypothetical protein